MQFRSFVFFLLSCQVVYCNRHELFALIHGKKQHEKEVYNAEDILKFDVSQDELDAAKSGELKCVCFPWVSFLFFYGGILIVFCRLIIVPNMTSFTRAMAPAKRFTHPRDFQKQFLNGGRVNQEPNAVANL
jgi:hypothetical protein